MAKLLATDLIRDVYDFPKQGTLFRDITPVLQNSKAFFEVVESMAEKAKETSAEAILGIESKGFLFGAPIALMLGIPFLTARKLGKLPYARITEEYRLEYGTNTVELHVDSVSPKQNVYIVDDLLATGGTAAASAKLVERLQGNVCGFGFLLEISYLKGRQNLLDYPIHSLIQY